jgi:hypothetical protein
MRHAVFIGHGDGTRFYGHRFIHCHCVSVQNISEEIRERKDQSDAVLVSTYIVKACETGHSSILCKVVDPVRKILMGIMCMKIQSAAMTFGAMQNNRVRRHSGEV